jgi:hypothetical protein
MHLQFKTSKNILKKNKKKCPQTKNLSSRKIAQQITKKKLNINSKVHDYSVKDYPTFSTKKQKR